MKAIGKQYVCMGENCDHSYDRQLAAAIHEELKEPVPLKLDIGCGPNPKEGYEGVDIYSFDGKVKHVFDLRKPHWNIFKDNSVEAVNCTHFLEHLTNYDNRWERVHFFNELYRIMRKGSSMNLVFPHWCSNRYYGDPTHKEPFSEMAFYYLDKNWRMANAPHTDISYNHDGGYYGDWQFVVAYGVHPELIPKSQPNQEFAMKWYKEACTDIIATLTPRKE
jgi:hypothetical protein